MTKDAIITVCALAIMALVAVFGGCALRWFGLGY